MRLSVQNGLFSTRRAGMPPLHASPFGGSVEEVTPSFITCQNLSNKISSFVHVFKHIVQTNTYYRRFLTVWQMFRHPHCTNFVIRKTFVKYGLHSSFNYSQFNIYFTCVYSTILPYEPIHSQNRTTVNHRSVASPLCLSVRPHNTAIIGIFCTVRNISFCTQLSSYEKFLTHARLLRKEIKYQPFVLIKRNPLSNQLQKISWNEDVLRRRQVHMCNRQ